MRTTTRCNGARDTLQLTRRSLCSRSRFLSPLPPCLCFRRSRAHARRRHCSHLLKYCRLLSLTPPSPSSVDECSCKCVSRSVDPLRSTPSTFCFEWDSPKQRGSTLQNHPDPFHCQTPSLTLSALPYCLRLKRLCPSWNPKGPPVLFSACFDLLS